MPVNWPMGEATWQTNYDSYQQGVTQLADSRKQLDDYIAQADALRKPAE